MENENFLGKMNFKNVFLFFVLTYCEKTEQPLPVWRRPVGNRGGGGSHLPNPPDFSRNVRSTFSFKSPRPTAPFPSGFSNVPTALKVSKFQKENMKSSHFPKSEQKN